MLQSLIPFRLAEQHRIFQVAMSNIMYMTITDKNMLLLFITPRLWAQILRNGHFKGCACIGCGKWFCSNTAIENHMRSEEHERLAERLYADPEELNKYPAMLDITMIDSTTNRGFHTSSQLWEARIMHDQKYLTKWCQHLGDHVVRDMKNDDIGSQDTNHRVPMSN